MVITMGEKPIILVADDDEVNRGILRKILEGEYDILEAEDGEQALEVLSAHEDEIAGVILDLIMPRMDGYGFLKRYSAVEHWRNIPVLISTGDERESTENRCLELGAWDILKKPFKPGLVYLRLKNSISRRRLSLLEAQRISDIFQRYVDPSVVKELLRPGAPETYLRGKDIEIAVLFVDIRGFTAMSEHLPSEEVVEMLNIYLSLTSRVIKQHGGTLDKFIGDCTMAFWGAPLPCEDKAYRACLAAVEIIQGGRKLADEVRGRFGYAATFGIGVHAGPAVVGNVGAPDRMDYTAIGDTVNTASRLESQAPSDTIYISRAVAQDLGRRAATTSLGTISLKGKKAGFEVLTLDRLLTEGGEFCECT